MLQEIVSVPIFEKFVNCINKWHIYTVPRSIILILLLAFVSNAVGPLPSVDAQGLSLPPVGGMIGLSQNFIPAHLTGIMIHPDNALRFDFLIHTSDLSLNIDQKKQEYQKLIRYFLASLTVPDDDQWVTY